MVHIHRRRLAFRVAPPPPPPTLTGKRLADGVALALALALAAWLGWHGAQWFADAIDALPKMPVMEARR